VDFQWRFIDEAALPEEIYVRGRIDTKNVVVYTNVKIAWNQIFLLRNKNYYYVVTIFCIGIEVGPL
jgi:hypothetical protein